MNYKNLTDAIIMKQRVKPIAVDDWEPSEEDKIFRYSKNVITLNISQYLGRYNDDELNSFILSKKRAYNNEKMHEHITKYLNYFIKFYDTDNELLSVYYRLKPFIDHNAVYNENAFLYDIDTQLLTESMIQKVVRMVKDNYKLEINHKNTIDPSLQYTNAHAMILMAISVLMNILIPLVCHYIYMNNLSTNQFLLKTYDLIFNLSSVDLYNKLYETISTSVSKTRGGNALWDRQDIRGNNFTTHSIYCIENIVLNIMPRYTFDKNIISFNFTSIRTTTGYQIIEIAYEYKFVSYSSSDRDEDYNSAFDKFERYLITQNEGLLLQNEVNASYAMEQVERLYGPFDEKEVDFYIDSLTKDNSGLIIQFQQTLIKNLFCKYFGDPNSFKAIQGRDYVKLMIAAKRMLVANNMIILPYIISGKIVGLRNRKTINKKEMIKTTSSPYYPLVLKKYISTEIKNFLNSIIATILSSEFKIISYDNPEIHDKTIVAIPDIILEECLMYILMV